MIFIAGASGGLGRYIYDYKKNICFFTENRVGTHFSKPYKDTFRYDFSEDAKIIEDFAKDIEFVISTISLTDVDRSEMNPRESYDTTFNSSRNIADVCSRYDIPLVYISTNDLFDGERGNYTESDLPFPVNQYCLHKYLSEVYIKNICKRYLILRCSILETYSSFKKEPLIVSIFKNIENDQICNLFCDSFNSPVYLDTICDFCLNQDLHDGRIVHLYSERVSKATLGTIASKVMNKPIKINSISIDTIDFKAKRPKDVSLSSIYSIGNRVNIEEEVGKTYKEYLNLK